MNDLEIKLKALDPVIWHMSRGTRPPYGIDQGILYIVEEYDG